MTRIQFSSVDDIQGEAREALIELLYRLGDDDLVIGHRHTEWTGLAPILEADIAFSSIAQDQIGQARAYYQLLHELGEPDPDAIAFGRGPTEYRCASLCVLEKGDWGFSTMRQYLYDTAKSLRLEALASSHYEPLAALTQKLRGEQKYHLMHARMWITRLGDATEASHATMQKALDELFPHALGLFEPTAEAAVVASSGIGPDESALGDTWRAETAKLLTSSGLNVPSDAKPIYGGRRGVHPPEMVALLDDLQKVYKLDPSATW